MAKNSKGGKGHKKAKNSSTFKRELIFKDDSQEYAQVLKMLGNSRIEAYCFDGVKRLCHIRGTMRKKVWIAPNDIILVSLRDYQDDKADVIAKYNPDEARTLKAYGELPESAKINAALEHNDDQNDDNPFEFTEDTDNNPVIQGKEEIDLPPMDEEEFEFDVDDL